MINEASELLVKLWFEAYRHSRRLTIVLTLGTLLVSAVSVGVALWLLNNAEQRAEAQRQRNQTYTRQLESLERTKESLQNLLEFVDEQRVQLAQTQGAVESMKSERAKLKPLVEADQNTIDALFAAQEARNQAANSRERWVGFAQGVITSLVASFIWAVGIVIFRRRKKSDGDDSREATAA